MTGEERLMELLRRAHTVIGEGLIANELDESAADLHDEIGKVFGLESMSRGRVRCGAALNGSLLADASRANARRRR